jgi:hypothetical protein
MRRIALAAVAGTLTSCTATEPVDVEALIALQENDLIIGAVVLACGQMVRPA